MHKVIGLKRYVMNQQKELVAEYKLDEIPEISTVLKRIAANEGCKVTGVLEINKVPGNLRFSMKGVNGHFTDAVIASGYNLKMDHHIHKMQFGDDTDELFYLKRRFARGRPWNSLDNTVG